MLLPDFELQRPESLDEALVLLKELEKQKKTYSIMAGGSDVIPNLKKIYRAPDVMVSLKKMTKQLSGIRLEEGKLLIGAMTKLETLINDAHINKYAPALAYAASKVASPQIRQQATIGGNVLVDNRCVHYNQGAVGRASESGCFKAGGDACQLIPNATRESSPVCRARFVSDLAPVLIVMQSKIVFRNSKETQSKLLKEIYSEDGLDSQKIAEGEIVTEIEVPIAPTETVMYEKLRIRNAIDFPSLGVAVRIKKHGDKIDLKVCLTGVNTTPVELDFQEENYNSKEEFLLDIEKQSTKKVSPLKQDFFPPQYRRQMIPVIVKRLLSES